ncbi:hypothetical protein ABZ628_29490 [Streptomyces diastaticus]|uniref:hypothetical protein n=1 Tax=Streptomyces diastaticus TaxID=1956 RepID=UPI0033D06618
MREIQIKMAADGDLHTEELAKYPRGDDATDLKKSVLRNESMGIRFTGRPEMKPQVTAVKTEGKTATVTDCFDATSWKPVYKDSGKKLKLAEQRLKYPAREAYGDLVVHPTIRDDVKVPESHSVSLPVTLYNPKTEAATAYVKVGRAMKLYD